MKKIIFILIIFIISSCSTKNLTVKKESGEKYIINKSLVRSKKFNFNNLIEIIRNVESFKIDKLIKQQNESKEIYNQIERNKILSEELFNSQKLIDNNCGQWYRPKLCNKGINDLENNKKLKADGEMILEKIKIRNDLIIDNERSKLSNYINELSNINYASTHLFKITYSSTYFDINKAKKIIPARTINCFNPVLQEEFYFAWKKYAKLERIKLNFVDEKICAKFSNFNTN